MLDLYRTACKQAGDLLKAVRLGPQDDKRKGQCVIRSICGRLLETFREKGKGEGQGEQERESGD